MLPNPAIYFLQTIYGHISHFNDFILPLKKYKGSVLPAYIESLLKLFFVKKNLA